MEEEQVVKQEKLGYRCSLHVDLDWPDGANLAFASGYTGEGKFWGKGHRCQYLNCDRIAKYYFYKKGEIK